jgi:N-acetyl-gamma-glutamyl-phosphate reductase
VRGIFATSFITLKEKSSQDKIAALYKKAYEKEPFVRLVEGSPNIKWVANSNFADVSVAVNEKQVIVMTAIDNLIKGGAGQAVQCMNIMFEFEETEGLRQLPGNP